LLWLLVSVLLRKLADSNVPGSVLAEVYSQQGVWFVFGFFGFFVLGLLTRLRAEPSSGLTPFALGAMALFLAGLTLWRTIPIYPFVQDGLKRDNDGFIRQGTAATCAPVSLGNLMEQGYGRKAPNERELARLSGTTFFGTTTWGLLRAARALDIPLESPQAHSIATLGPGPALIQISTLPSVRHLTLFIGTRGTQARLIDPDYGYEEQSMEWLERVLYGKMLKSPEARSIAGP
jgi:hypothetical protein